MNIALPILLLIFGGLTFWLLTESSLKWYYKMVCISAFCVFTGVFWGTIHSYLGWPADEADVPDKVLVHWVVIKEPNKYTEFKGAIYFLLESAEEEKGSLLKFLGYKSDRSEPRLYGLPYSRKLHEQIEKQLREALKRGQPVMGRLSKIKEQGKGKKGSKKGSNKKGDGSESQEQEWQFHSLRPSDFLEKPDRTQ
jgi:hypothetical protein